MKNKILWEKLEELQTQVDNIGSRSLPWNYIIAPEKLLIDYTPESISSINSGFEQFLMFRGIFVKDEIWNSERMPHILQEIRSSIIDHTEVRNIDDYNNWQPERYGLIFIADVPKQIKDYELAEKKLNETLKSINLI